jgi:hypothetical protein
MNPLRYRAGLVTLHLRLCAPHFYPTRDDTGDLGKHGYGGMVTPPRHRKNGTGNPPPTVRAPEFYPNPPS